MCKQSVVEVVVKLCSLFVSFSLPAGGTVAITLISVPDLAPVATVEIAVMTTTVRKCSFKKCDSVNFKVQLTC